MSLRQKTLFTIGVTLIGLTAILYVSLRTLFLDGLARLEEQAGRQHVERALGALAHEVAALEMLASEHAARDDTRACIEGPTERHVETYLGEGQFVQHRLGLWLLLDASGQVVLARGFDLASRSAAPIPADLQPGSALLDSLARLAGTGQGVGGVVLLSEGPMLIAARPVTASGDAARAVGMVVVGTPLDAAAVQRLGESTSRSLEVRRFDDPQLPGNLRAPALLSLSRPILLHPVGASSLVGYGLVKDVFGQPALVVSLTMTRTFYAQGVAIVSYLILVLTLVGLAFAVVTMGVVLDRIVLGRLLHLHASVAAIGKSGDLSARVPVGDGDELSQLARAINGMLEALERSQRDEQRARAELQESEELLRSVVENIAIGVWVADRDFRIRLWNASQEAATAVSRGEALGQNVFSLFPHLVEAGVDVLYRRVLATGEPLVLNGLALPGGAARGPRYLNIIAKPLNDAQGQITGILLAEEDITERKRAERVQTVAYRIAEAANRGPSLESLIRYIRQDLGTILDTKNFYIAVYDREQQMLRFPFYVDETFPEPGYTTTGSRRLGRGMTEYVMRTGEPILADATAIQELAAKGEIEIIGPMPTVWLGAPLQTDGRVIGVVAVQSYTESATYTRSDLELLRFVSGQIASAIERKRTEELLQHQSAAMQASMDGMAVLNREGEHIALNEAYARVYGYASPEELTGQPWRLLYAEEELARFDAEIMPRLWREGQWRGEAVGRRRDGSTFPQEVSLTAIRGGGLVSVVRDVSQRKRLEEQLRQSQKMEAIGRLAGGVAHDFNNLLTAIAGYASFVRDALAADNPAQEDIAQVLKAAERAANLTRQLLAFSRRQIIAPQIINVNDVILNLHKMLRRLISEDIDLVTLAAPDLGAVKADPGQIEQVLINLVVNAGDAMPEGGRLTIETSNVTLDEEYARRHVDVVPGDYVMLAVSDTGCGMTDEVKARIFEPFFTTKEPGKGTGLGLATCYGIVKQSGGHIWFYSEAGKGTTFKIYLPRVEARAHGMAARGDESVRLRGGQTVLLVEDDLSVRGFAARVLREQGYVVLEAADGEEALALARQRQGAPVHLLVTDVVMPQMGGKELARQLKELHPALKVLFVSGYTENAIAHQAVLEPGVAFLQKPFTLATLTRKVREVLGA